MKKKLKIICNLVGCFRRMLFLDDSGGVYVWRVGCCLRPWYLFILVQTFCESGWWWLEILGVFISIVCTTRQVSRQCSARFFIHWKEKPKRNRQNQNETKQSGGKDKLLKTMSIPSRRRNTQNEHQIIPSNAKRNNTINETEHLINALCHHRWKQVSEALGLPDIRSRQWSIQEASALKGKGLFEGFDWWGCFSQKLELVWCLTLPVEYCCLVFHFSKA